MPTPESWDEEKIRQAILTARDAFGDKCPKSYTGALTVEYIRRGLAQHGIPTSPRDVYIKGVPSEIDVIVPKNDASPECGILYGPEDVLAAIEVKYHGVFGKGWSSRDSIRACFERIERGCPGVWCAYVTLTERKSWKNRPTKNNLGYDVYTLFWDPTAKKPQYEPTGDWIKLVEELSKRLGKQPSGRLALV